MTAQWLAIPFTNTGSDWGSRREMSKTSRAFGSLILFFVFFVFN